MENPMEIQSSVRSDPSKGFPNYEGVADVADVDDALALELENAGISVLRLQCLKDGKSEVNTSVRGELPYWGFERAWYYWRAKGPGIPPKYADELHRTHGKVVRVNGDCTAPSPLESNEGFAVGSYHVDTPEGLKALADTIKQVIADAAAKKQAVGEKGCGCEGGICEHDSFFQERVDAVRAFPLPSFPDKEDTITKKHREIADYLDSLAKASDGFTLIPQSDRRQLASYATQLRG